MLDAKFHMYILKAANAEDSGAMAVVFMLDSSRPTSSPPTSRVYGSCKCNFICISIFIDRFHLLECHIVVRHVM